MGTPRRGCGGEAPHFPVGVVPGRVGKVPCGVPTLSDRDDVEKTLDQRPCFTGSIADIRAQFAAIGKNIGPLFPPASSSVQVTDKQINAHLTVRIFRPVSLTGAERLPVGIFYHGGGFAVGDLDADAADARYFAEHSGCVVVSVGYRLAPEVTYNDILKDAIEGYEWSLENAAELGGDPDTIFAIGESAGACLAMQVTRALIKRGQKAQVQGVVALCPLAAHPASVPEKYRPVYTSYDENGEGVPMIDRKVMETFFASAKMEPSDPSHFITVSEEIGEFPRTFIITTEKDPLRDDGVVLHHMLRDNGVVVRRQHYNGFGHVFWNFPMLKKRDVFLRDACEGVKFVLTS